MNRITSKFISIMMFFPFYLQYKLDLIQSTHLLNTVLKFVGFTQVEEGKEEIYNCQFASQIGNLWAFGKLV
jgi:hypothetical protein